jgi:transposase
LVSRNVRAPAGRSRACGPKLSYAARARAIESARERRLNEIESLRRDGLAPGCFVDKAQKLLTYAWSKATWRSRENILRTVDWLLHVDRIHRSGLESQTDRPAALMRGGVR